MTDQRKRGGQPGNQNARGNRGNPHPNPPPIQYKHGTYMIPHFDRTFKAVPVEEWRAMLPILREYENKHGVHRRAKYREYVYVPVEDWAIIEQILIDYQNRDE